MRRTSRRPDASRSCRRGRDSDAAGSQGELRRGGPLLGFSATRRQGNFPVQEKSRRTVQKTRQCSEFHSPPNSYETKNWSSHFKLQGDAHPIFLLPRSRRAGAGRISGRSPRVHPCANEETTAGCPAGLGTQKWHPIGRKFFRRGLARVMRAFFAVRPDEPVPPRALPGQKSTAPHTRKA